MKLCLRLLLVAIVATLLHFSEYASADICREENCMDSSKCEYVAIGNSCPQPTDVCCSSVKEEYRTHCNHFLGACMESCNPDLQHTVVDCPADEVCCTLV